MKHVVRLAAVALLALAFTMPVPQVVEASGMTCRECLEQCYLSGATSYDCVNDICPAYCNY